MRQLMTRFLQDESGSILMITGLLMAVFIALSGAVYDLGAQQLIKAHTQQAMDAATISGAVTDQDNAVAAANIFWEANYPDVYMDAPRPTLQAAVQGSNLVLRAEYTIDTGFTKTLGTGEQAVVSSSKSPLAEVLNPTDLIMVVDNSNSMNAADVGSAFVLHADPDHLQTGYPGASDTGCYEFADKYLGDSFKRNPQCKLSGQAGLTNQATLDNRLNALRYSADLLAKTLLEDNDDAGEDYNQVAMVAFSDTASVQDGLLTQFNFKRDYADTTPYIMTMFQGLGTDSTKGMEKAWEYASGPLFRDDSVHAVVLLTDGENNKPAIDNPATLAICDDFKNTKDAMIFTVLFGDHTGEPEEVYIRDFLTACATSSQYFYYAKDATALKEAFEDIIKTTNQVRLIK